MPRPLENGQNPSKNAELNGKLNNGEIVDGNKGHEMAQRPPAIEEDLWEMGRRKRVKEVLGAEDFRSELEQIVRPDFAKSFPEGLNCAIQGAPVPFSSSFARLFPGHILPSLPPLNVNQVLQNAPIPIADLPARSEYSPEEKRQRNKLATFYRLVDLFQWSQGIYNHITLRLPGPDPPQILINPFGLLYHEITANSLIKLTLAGEVLDQGSTNLGVNQAAYVLHSAIHEARPDVHCVLHLHTAVVAAIGSMKCGLLPICQEAMIIGPVAYHDYQGILTDDEEKKTIVRDLGDKNVMLLRNHGFVVCGQTVEDALHLAFHTIIACETQILILRDKASFICCGDSAEEVAWICHNFVISCQNQIRAARAGIENLIIPSEEAVEKAYKTARRGGGGVNRIKGQNGGGNGNGPGWGIGELEWEAWCRTLDTAGFCTGHAYRNAARFRPSAPSQTLPNSHHSMFNLASVATPPSGPSSIGAVDESEGAAAWRLSMLRKERERARWLNSPCQYQKVQLLETGSANPRLVTKWVEQNGCASASSGGTPVKIDSPHQFSPSNGPDKQREFRERQRRLKEIRMSGTISPGPKSQVLEGITLEEAMEKQEMANTRPVYIGTASKGIIQRDKQINAQVYRQMYAPNPFRGESEQNLKEYLREVGEKGAARNSAPPPSLAMNGVAIPPHSLPGSPTGIMPESPTMDTASLMQAVKRVKLNGRSASGDGENEGGRGGGMGAKENGKKNGNGRGKEMRGTGKEVGAIGEKKQQQKRRRGIFFFGRKRSS